MQKHAQTLRTQTEPSIDDLLRIVNESVEAYAVCKSRIDAVDKALEKTLAASGAEVESEAQNQDQPGISKGSSGFNDEDIPF